MILGLHRRFHITKLLFVDIRLAVDSFVPASAKPRLVKAVTASLALAVLFFPGKSNGRGGSAPQLVGEG